MKAVEYRWVSEGGPLDWHAAHPIHMSYIEESLANLVRGEAVQVRYDNGQLCVFKKKTQ